MRWRETPRGYAEMLSCFPCEARENSLETGSRSAEFSEKAVLFALTLYLLGSRQLDYWIFAY